jgi:hypothetical protein
VVDFYLPSSFHPKMELPDEEGKTAARLSSKIPALPLLRKAIPAWASACSRRALSYVCVDFPLQMYSRVITLFASPSSAGVHKKDQASFFVRPLIIILAAALLAP